jgi:4-diphosphocytidyl-2-C-methyl-D-erythritol kinase
MKSASPAEQETAYAKINLALHVRARRADGYHQLDTLFAFCEDGDQLAAWPEDRISLTIEGPFSDGLEADDDNLVLRAADALSHSFGISAGAAIRLDKRLPVAAGIGGGSADAAATLRMLCRLWKLPVDDPKVMQCAVGLGADVPACLASMAVRGEGRGDELTPVPEASLSGKPVLLVNPRIPLATGPVFTGWDGIDRGGLSEGDPLDAARTGRNDLQTPAETLVPIVREIVAMLGKQAGALMARMSGSGATCFALFDTQGDCDAAARSIGGIRPDWWCLASRLI